MTVRRFFIGAGILVLLFLATLIPFLWPRMDSPRRADAVVLLSGDHGERLPVALRLLEAGVAPTLVFDGTLDRALEQEWCAGGQEFEAVCLRPQPDSTRAEARAAAELARSRGWDRLVVVTSDFHVTRSRFLFNRCFQGTVEAVGSRPSYGWGLKIRQIAHEWLAMAQTLLIDRGC